MTDILEKYSKIIERDHARHTLTYNSHPKPRPSSASPRPASPSAPLTLPTRCSSPARYADILRLDCERDAMSEALSDRECEATVEEDTADVGEFAPRVLLWTQMRSMLPPAEVGEVKSVVGAQLIDRNEELDTEIRALWDIYQDFSGGSEHKFSSSAFPPKSFPSRSKELLESQIRLLLAGLRQQSEKHGLKDDDRFIHEIVRPQTARQKEVVKMFVDPTSSSSSPFTKRATSAESRPRTALSSRSMAETNTDFSSRPSTAASISISLNRRHSASRLSTPSTVISAADSQFFSDAFGCQRADLAPVQPYLNAFEIDKVTNVIRSWLDEEHQLLLADIDFLNRCIEEESDKVHSPSEKELRTLSHHLEHALLSVERAVPLPSVNRERPSSPASPRLCEPLAPRPPTAVSPQLASAPASAPTRTFRAPRNANDTSMHHSASFSPNDTTGSLKVYRLRSLVAAARLTDDSGVEDQNDSPTHRQ